MLSQDKTGNTRKICVCGSAAVILSLFFGGLAYTRTIEEIKAKAKAEVMRELGRESSAKPAMRQQRKSEQANGTLIKKHRNRSEIVKQLVLISMGIALIPAMIAKVKGRSFIAWWVLGLLCFIVVLPASLYMKKIKPYRRHNG